MTAGKALVTSHILKWARESAHLHLDQAAKKIGTTEERLVKWESGEDLPSIKQARRAAEVYGRPLAVFFLDEIPTDFSIIRDFRKVPQAKKEYSYALTLLIRELQARQDWAREILKELHESAISYVGSATVNDNPEAIAGQIRAALQVSLDDQFSWKSMNDALNSWIDGVESIRVFVSQTSRRGEIAIEDARGFALADTFAPFVFLNPKDSLGGRIFTLIHELAHIWIGASGVSGAELTAKPGTDEDRIEKFCNLVAVNALLPKPAFQDALSNAGTTNGAETRIDVLARQFRVSRDVVARRFAESKLISWPAYARLHEQYIRDWKDEQARRPGGGNYYVNHVRALSRGLVLFVGDVYSRGRITGGEASGLLNVKLDNLGKLMQMAHSGGGE